MQLSSIYSSIQPVQVGDVVQLLYGKKDFVMRVYDKSTFGFDLRNLSTIKQIAIFENHTIIVREISRGVLAVNFYDANILVWSRIINALTIYETQLAVGEAGIFVLFQGDGVITLPNGRVIQQGLVTVLVQFSLQGDVSGSTTIQGPNYTNITYDLQTNRISIFGASSKPLIIGGSTIIDKSSLYSFFVFFAPTLIPINPPLVADDLSVELAAAGKNNIAFTDTVEDITTLYFHGTLGQDWSVILGTFDVDELGIFNNFVALVGKEVNQEKLTIYQFDFNGIQVSKTVLPIEGEVLQTKFASGDNRFVLYTTTVIPGGHVLTEYDIFDDIITWTTPLNFKPDFLGGTITSIVVANDSRLESYGKRLPALVGAVSEVLWPDQTGQTGQT